jgi:hypothetical protein
MSVYKAINAVQSAMCVEGISKDRKNQQQGYSFRGIDDVFNALSPLLSKHGLCILPRVLNRECVERINSKGTALFYVTVEVEFDFVCAEDGSKHIVKTFGEAMDSGDKATNKALSAAMKYACLQAFCIPTEGDNDADAHTHEVAPRGQPVQYKSAPEQPKVSQEAEDTALGIIEAYKLDDTDSVIRLWYKSDISQDVKSQVWGLLKSTQGLREFITKNKGK